MRTTSRAPTWLIFGFLLSIGATPAAAQGTPQSWKQQDWGLGFTLRTTTIPFATEEKTVSTLIPLIMYEGKRLFLYETEGGLKFIENPRWRVSAIGRAHYFDIPSEFQNQVQGDRLDLGAQVRFKPWDRTFLDFEALSDMDGHVSGHARIGTEIGRDRIRVQAWGDAGFKTAHYNSFFWGLGQEHVNGGVDLGIGAKGYVHLISSLYLQGALGATYLSRPIRETSLVEDNFKIMGSLGVGISNDRIGTSERTLAISPYWRISHQWASPSSLAKIIRFQGKPDPFGGQLSTVFYGLPLTDRLFTLPLHVYLHSGLGFHWPSDYQDSILEGVVSIKVNYTIPLPWRLRLGFAEGLSVVTTVPARERENLEDKGYQPSQYLNYLDPSLDINLGDIFPWRVLEGVWLGTYIHHRSAIFETSQQFGRIKGGSNFRGIYLQFEG